MSLVFVTMLFFFVCLFFFWGGGGGGVFRHLAVQTDFEFEISGSLKETIMICQRTQDEMQDDNSLQSTQIAIYN